MRENRVAPLLSATRGARRDAPRMHATRAAAACARGRQGGKKEAHRQHQRLQQQATTARSGAACVAPWRGNACGAATRSARRTRQAAAEARCTLEERESKSDARAPRRLLLRSENLALGRRNHFLVFYQKLCPSLSHNVPFSHNENKEMEGTRYACIRSARRRFPT